MTSAAIYLCFVLSGAAALIYEIVWQRMLTLVFGLSTMSVAAVLSAFLAGLALGARLAGPLADRSRRPLRLYAAIELGIALLGTATLVVIPLLMQAFTAAYRSDSAPAGLAMTATTALETGWARSNAIRFVLAFIAIGIPSLLIGATMPVMSRLVATRSLSAARGFGLAYAVNAAGAVAGAALAGFVFLPWLGVRNALLCAAAANLGVAALAWRLATAWPATDGRSSAPPRDHGLLPASPDTYPRLTVMVAALSGLLSLAYEIAWLRLLAIFTLNSVYVFTMVVSVYLAALALGAGLATHALRRRVDPFGLLALGQLLLALSVPVLLSLTPWAATLRLNSGEMSESAIFLTEYALVAAVVFVPTTLLGLTLPLLVGIAARTPDEAGRLVGRIYAWNAVGTIVAAALTGPVLIPLLGLRGVLLLLAAGNMLTVAIAAGVGQAPSRWLRLAAPAGAAVFAALLALYPGPAQFILPDEPDPVRAAQSPPTVLYYAEGPSATVHVAEYDDGRTRHRTLFVDSKSVAGTYPEIVTDQKMLAHLPLLLHPDPRRALTVGFGTGGTSYSMLQHKLDVECVEIEPRVPDAYRLFESQNHGFVGPGLDRREFRLILDDARAWLHVAPHAYDVIVTDLTSIQYRGNGNLYTAECFKLLQSRLNPGGVAAAWVPITGITPEALKLLVRTFRSVFDHTSVWYMINLPTDFVILVGTPQRLDIPLACWQQRLAAPLVQRDLSAIGMDNPWKLAAGLLLAEEQVERYCALGPLHTDDRPLLDYLTHATPYHSTLRVNMEQMLALRSDAAHCVANWPPRVEGESEPQTEWQRWREFSRLMIEGHMSLRMPTPDRVSAALASYRAALEVIPDQRTQRLVADLSAE